jgi:hypothetical protein
MVLWRIQVKFKASRATGHKFDVYLTIHHWCKKCRWPTRCNNNNLLIFQSAQHVSGNFLPVLGSARLWFTACGIMHPSRCRPVVWNAEALTQRVEQHPLHRTYSQCLRVPDHRPAATWVHYTTRCKSQSCAPEDWQKIARNMLSWMEYQ